MEPERRALGARYRTGRGQRQQPGGAVETLRDGRDPGQGRDAVMSSTVIDAVITGAVIFGIGCFTGAFIFYWGMHK